MSRSLYIIDLQTLELPEPESIEEFMGFIKPWLKRTAPHNPRFVAMAEGVVAKFADPEVGDRAWLDSFVDDARKDRAAAWHMDLPAQDTVAVMAELVRQGTAVGLSLYDDQLGLGFLPGGSVIPPERQEEWDLFLEALDEQPARPTLKQMRQKMRNLFEQRLAPYGFVLTEDTGERVRYRREYPEGWQRMTLSVLEIGSKYRCQVDVAGVCNQVNAIAEVGQGRPIPVGDYAVRCSNFVAPSSQVFDDIEGKDKLEAMFAFVDSQVIPVLDRIRDVSGLNWACNHPDAPGGIGKHLRKTPYTSLICAWLTRDPAFDERVMEFSENTARLANANPAGYGQDAVELQQLLVHLRENVKPLA